MTEKETENMKNKDENNKNNMNEKVHYEIKFVETDDGYRLEASGDKDALKRLGIGPNMVGRVRKPGRGRAGGRRGRRHGRGHRAMAQRNRRMNRRRQSAASCQPEGPAFAPRRHFHGPRRHWHAAPGYGRFPGMGMPGSIDEDPGDTWTW